MIIRRVCEANGGICSAECAFLAEVRSEADEIIYEVYQEGAPVTDSLTWLRMSTDSYKNGLLRTDCSPCNVDPEDRLCARYSSRAAETLEDLKRFCLGR